MSEIQGFQVPTEGTYVLLDDVISAIRAYAQSLEDPNAGGLIHDLATWLDGGRDPEVQVPETSGVAEAPHGQEPDDVTEGVARVEVYPDPPDHPNPKWFARTVDTSGYVIKVTDGDFDQAFVIRNAEERFAGVPILLLKHAGEDSKYMEDSTRGVFPSIGPPVRRLWQGIPEGDRTQTHSQLGAP